MANNRREFIRKGSSIAAMSVLGINSARSEAIGNSLMKDGLQGKAAAPKSYLQDAGIKMSFAYFGGIEAERRKIEFGKQLNVLGAVGGTVSYTHLRAHETDSY